MEDLRAWLAKEHPGVEFTSTAVEVPQGQPKPFDLTLNGDMIWSSAANGAPILFKDNKWSGKANVDTALPLITQSIAAASKR